MWKISDTQILLTEREYEGGNMKLWSYARKQRHGKFRKVTLESFGKNENSGKT
jgi:hypothetical protein